MASIQIGEVGSLQGTVRVERADGSTDTLQLGSPVYADDVIRTGGDSAVQITFLDKSDFQLGPDFTAILNKDIFDPAAATVATPIGVASSIEGDPTVLRANGTGNDLSHGDYLYSGDLVATSPDGAVVIRMLDGSDMHIEPGTTARFDSGLSPSEDTDLDAIRAAVLDGRDPTELLEDPAAGEEAGQEDSGNSFVKLEATGRQLTPESGFETTPIGYGFTDLHEELLQNPQEPEEPPIINLLPGDGIGDAVVEGETLVFTVELDGPNNSKDVSAVWTVTLGTAETADFPPNTLFSGIVTIPSGETTATIEIPTFDDTLFEGGAGTMEDLTLTLTDISHAIPGNVTAIGLIEDNDATVVDFKPGAEGTDVTVTEGDPGGPDATITFTLELS
ncbi:MAG: retention module-containing protein, partial [Gammaproteobacteria bacterium]|nr:retention module-containing protein [Gammaproteobacteria bacterium]